ncbi:baseplate hub [Pseudoalteromonas phage H101]|uniref:Tail protein n=1 Tax=Pseudoalteromonas phage H101 TaxID=1654919 RepID=A0A0H4IN04_9CAUD|nr:baseplate hub [Pseudoalteromonas phage H101]AKO60919.1 hypothetical protein [Pseudoalteromonas phage H101]
MSLLYDRKYRLVIGQPSNSIQYTGEVSSVNLETLGVFSPTNYVNDYRFEYGGGTEITDLQIIADVAGNSNTGKQAGCVIKIYNLSDETRAQIEDVNNYLILEAGYAQDDELKLIFSGQIFNFNTEKQGQDLVTTLQCKDGFTPNNGVRVAKTYAKGLTYADVLYDLTRIFADNGIPTGQLEMEPLLADRQTYVQLRTPQETILRRGYSAVGFLRQIMDNVCNSLGYVWYITNGRLFCHPKGYTKMVELYEFNTDQLLSIRRTGDQTVSTSTGKGDVGVKIVTFLDGRLDVDKMIRVTNGQYQGDYKVLSKSHSLDYRNGGWTTTIECKKTTT